MNSSNNNIQIVFNRELADYLFQHGQHCEWCTCGQFYNDDDIHYKYGFYRTSECVQLIRQWKKEHTEPQEPTVDNSVKEVELF